MKSVACLFVRVSESVSVPVIGRAFVRVCFSADICAKSVCATEGCRVESRDIDLELKRE